MSAPADRAYWGERRSKSGALLAKLGPYATRELAHAHALTTWGDKRFSVGWGATGALFDVRWGGRWP